MKGRNRKSFLSILLTLCLLAGLIPEAAFAEGDTAAQETAYGEAAKEAAEEETKTAEEETAEETADITQTRHR